MTEPPRLDEEPAESRSTEVEGATAGPIPGAPSLGAAAVLLCVAAAVSGVGLMFHYRPDGPAQAYASLLDLREASPMGFLHGLHAWTAHLLLIVLWIHGLRSMFRGSYRAGGLRNAGGPRNASGQGNWVIGVALLALVLGLAATGHTLSHPHSVDTSSAWSLWQVYVLHCAVLPVAVGLGTYVHLRWARRRAAESTLESTDTLESTAGIEP